MTKLSTKPKLEEKARCMSCEYQDMSMFAAALGERHSTMSGHSVQVTKTETYILRGEA